MIYVVFFRHGGFHSHGSSVQNRCLLMSVDDYRGLYYPSYIRFFNGPDLRIDMYCNYEHHPFTSYFRARVPSGCQGFDENSQRFLFGFLSTFSDISSFCEYLPVVVFASQGFFFRRNHNFSQCSKFMVDDLFGGNTNQC